MGVVICAVVFNKEKNMHTINEILKIVSSFIEGRYNREIKNFSKEIYKAILVCRIISGLRPTTPPIHYFFDFLLNIPNRIPVSTRTIDVLDSFGDKIICVLLIAG